MMCDGATVRAGLHVQGMISSECVTLRDDDGKAVFSESFLGFQMLQNGTDEHRIDRCEMIFDELLKCVRKFPQFLTKELRDDADFLASLDRSSTTATFSRMLGDHGENGVLSGLSDRIESDRIDERGFFYQEGGVQLEVKAVKKIFLFFCHFHKVLNIYDIARSAMCLAEEGDTVDLEADPEVDKDLAQDYPDLLGLLGKRRKGTRRE